jgi:hypothetical protein
LLSLFFKDLTLIIVFSLHLYKVTVKRVSCSEQCGFQLLKIIFVLHNWSVFICNKGNVCSCFVVSKDPFIDLCNVYIALYYLFSAQSPMSRETSVHFKEVQVKQLDKNALYNMPIQGYWLDKDIVSTYLL